MTLPEMFQKLVDVLDDEVKVYRHLLDLVRREKEILVAADIQELNESTKAKEAMISKLRTLERSREAVSRELALVLKVDAQRPRLLDLASKLDQEKGDRLISIHTVLDLLVRRVKEHNENNEVLAQSALRLVQGAMNSIKESIEPNKTYQKEGSTQTQVQPGQLVRREV